MSKASTLPRGTNAPTTPRARTPLDSPNISPGNRARSNRASTDASIRRRAGQQGNARANARRMPRPPQNKYRQNRARTDASIRRRAGQQGNSTANARRLSNLRNARSPQAAPTAPRVPTTGNPTAPIPRGIPATGVGGAGSASAGASIWTASPGAYPLATAALGTAAFGLGLGLGNELYEEVLGRPFGPSLGDLFFPGSQPMPDAPQRDGPAEEYPAPGTESPVPGGQLPGVMYLVEVECINKHFASSRDPLEYEYIGYYRGKFPGPIQGVEVPGLKTGGTPRDDLPTRLNLKYNGTLSLINGYAVSDGRDKGRGDNQAIGPATITKIERVDGQPDTGGQAPPPPVPVFPQPPYRPYRPTTPSGPTPQPDLEPDFQPIPARPPRVAPGATPSEYRDPFPETRPEPSTNPAFPPIPFLIPARATPPPGATQSPTAAPPPSSAPAPSATRRSPTCGCNAGIAASVSDRLSPLLEAQQAQGRIIASSLGGSGVILAKLELMQTFAEKAWKATRLDKLINLLTLVSVIHNAGMLSRDVGQTIGELASNMLATVGVKDENDSPLDINELVNTSVENFVKAVVGEEVYTNTSKAWLKANRIISAGTQIIYTVRSLHDTSQEVAEWTAENTGKIGNALKRWGVVGEKAFPWMAERVRAQDAHRRRFERITEGLENLEDTASSLSQVTSNVREIGEELTEFQQQRQAFKELVTVAAPEATAEASPENVPIAESAGQAALESQSPDVSIRDALNGG